MVDETKCYMCGCTIYEEDEEFLDDDGNSWCESCWHDKTEES